MASLGRTETKAWIAENFLFVPVVALVAIVATHLIFVVDRTPPIRLTNGVVIPEKVHPGATISTDWKLERIRDGAWSSVLSREIIDGRNKVTRLDSQIISDVVFPSNPWITKSTNIPYDAQYGSAKYRLVGCYRSQGFSLTRWFPVCVQWPELRFEIVPKP